MQKVSFTEVVVDTDSLLATGDATYGQSGVGIGDLVSNNPQWWIETDEDNVPHICTAIVPDSQIEAVFANAGTVTADYFVGGRPITRPH